MDILANENIPIASVFYLRKMGYDVKAISEFDFGIKDSDVMNIAINDLKLLPYVKFEDKSPYNPKFVKKIKDAMKRGNFKEVTASNLWENID